jgi:hypothetical protein
VDGFVGEEEFNREFAELVQSRFGSLERFQSIYPRIVLQRTAS